MLSESLQGYDQAASRTVAKLYVTRQHDELVLRVLRAAASS